MTPSLGIMASSFRSAAGPVGAYDSLATVTLSANTASVTFAGIPSGYKHLQLRYIARDSRAISGGNTVFLTVNGDTATNYSTHDIEANGASIGAGSETNGTRINFGVCTSANDGANIYGSGIVDILDYADTNKYKTARWFSGFDTNGAGLLRFISGAWRNTVAINRIDINATSGNFITYSSFALYGVK